MNGEVPPDAPSVGRVGADETGSRPKVPDHELLRLIGRGSYGEVWLARRKDSGTRFGAVGSPRSHTGHREMMPPNHASKIHRPMKPAEREQLKESLPGMIAGRTDGIDLDTPSHWVLEGRNRSRQTKNS